MSDTIYALATPPGRSGVAVIRVSGPSSFQALEGLSGRKSDPRIATLRLIVDPQSGEEIDRALVLSFEAPHSFTGEDVVEFQTHGSRAVTASLLRCLGDCSGLRAAEPGEFTRRAFANGKLDLLQVEGLSDLLRAETERQHRQAASLLNGTLSQKVLRWRESLVSALAHLEAGVDFADEDIPDIVFQECVNTIKDVLSESASLLNGTQIAERLRDGFEIAIVGKPNVGKSTLLNFLAARDVAITSDLPGTTRDIVEVSLDIDGLPVRLLDTAGLHETSDEIETIGIARTRDRAARTDLRLFLIRDAADLDDLGVSVEPDDLVYVSKADLCGAEGKKLSAVTGEGIESLLREIAGILSERAAGVSVLSHERQIAAIRGLVTCLERALDVAGATYPELLASELHAALHKLDYLVGKVDIEDVLDGIFSEFCIGK